MTCYATFTKQVEEEEERTEAFVESLKLVRFQNWSKESDEEIKAAMVDPITPDHGVFVKNPSQELNEKSSNDI